MIRVDVSLLPPHATTGMKTTGRRKLDPLRRLARVQSEDMEEYTGVSTYPRHGGHCGRADCRVYWCGAYSNEKLR